MRNTFRVFSPTREDYRVREKTIGTEKLKKEPVSSLRERILRYWLKKIILKIRCLYIITKIRWTYRNKKVKRFFWFQMETSLYFFKLSLVQLLNNYHLSKLEIYMIRSFHYKEVKVGRIALSIFQCGYFSHRGASRRTEERTLHPSSIVPGSYGAIKSNEPIS